MQLIWFLIHQYIEDLEVSEKQSVQCVCLAVCPNNCWSIWHMTCIYDTVIYLDPNWVTFKDQGIKKCSFFGYRSRSLTEKWHCSQRSQLLLHCGWKANLNWKLQRSKSQTKNRWMVKWLLKLSVWPQVRAFYLTCTTIRWALKFFTVLYCI